MLRGRLINASPKATKYSNTKVEFMGIKFDSKMERDYYAYLLEEQQKGKIKHIELQPVIELQPKFRDEDGTLIRAITYTPDFLVEYEGGSKVYYDVKGESTQQGELKRKMYMYQHQGGIPLVWVAPSRKYSPTGWIDWFELQRIRRVNRLVRQKLLGGK